MKNTFNITLLFLLLFGSGSGIARTITVARDGTGEYTVLQDALNVAASGDTLLLGPGEYTETTSIQYSGYPWPVDVAGNIIQSELTIIGSGATSTIIGPALHNVDYSRQTPNGFIWSGGTKCRLQYLTVRNCFDGFQIVGGPICVDNCIFEDNVRGVPWKNVGNGGYIGNTDFHTSYSYPQPQMDIWGTGGDVVVENCEIGSSPLDNPLSISFVEDVSISNCKMSGGVVGLQVGAGASVQLDNCKILDTSLFGIYITPVGARVNIQNSDISGGERAVYAYGESVFSATNTIFTGGSLGVMYLNYQNPATVRNCDIINGGSTYSVECLQFPEHGAVQHDFRGNYWGTTDPAQIDAWILDGHDDPNIRAEVLYTPFATGATDLVLALAPADSQIVIPDVGGTFQYDAYLENNTAGDIIADIAIEAVLPDGTVYPVESYPGQTIPAASAYTRTGIVQDVPPGAPAGTYTYRVTASQGDTVIVDSDEFPFEKLGVVAAAAQDVGWNLRGWDRGEPRTPPATPAGFALHAATPNPFNPTTTLSFDLPSEEMVTMRVFDLQGRLIRTLINHEARKAGRSAVQWDGRDDTGRQVASGTYFYRIEAGTHTATGRVTMVK